MFQVIFPFLIGIWQSKFTIKNSLSKTVFKDFANTLATTSWLFPEVYMGHSIQEWTK